MPSTLYSRCNKREKEVVKFNLLRQFRGNLRLFEDGMREYVITIAHS